MSEVILEGAISVKAALECGRRKVRELWMQDGKHNKDLGYIRRLASNAGVPVYNKTTSEIAEAASGKTHGGLIAFCEERIPDRIGDIKPLREHYFLAYLEGVEDPYNLGYAMRTLYAAGCDGLVMPARKWGNEEAVIQRSSAGAYDRLPLITYDEKILDFIDENGIMIFAAGRADAVNLYGEDYTGNVMIALGGPLRGLSAPITNAAYKTVYIPYERDFRNALNMSAALSVFAYEVYRQRNAVVL